MKKENVAVEPPTRITRARAAAYRSSDGVLPTKPLARQSQKGGPAGNMKRSILDENSSIPVAGQNKRRVVLKDVTNVLCESSYKSCMNAAKVQNRNCKQASKILVKKGSKVAPSVAVEAKRIKEHVETNIAGETTKMDDVAVSAQPQLGRHMEKIINEKVEYIGVVESQKSTHPVNNKENIPLPHIGGNIVAHNIADDQPGGHIPKKLKEHIFMLKTV